MNNISRVILRNSTRAVLMCTAAMVILAQAADHRDGSIAQDQPADIADTYAFVNPNDTSKVVLGVTVNPYTVPGVPASFSTDLLYQIKIDNTGDFKEDLVIQATYSPLGSGQMVHLRGPAKPRSIGATSRLLKGPATVLPSNGTIQKGDNGAIRVFSGRTDDPFFIDLVYVRSVLNVPGFELGGDFVSVRALGREEFRPRGVDLFTGLNVSSLMIELPVEALLGTDGSNINVWSTVSRQKVKSGKSSKSRKSSHKKRSDKSSWVQIDREGLPAINAALVAPPNRDPFNRAVPHKDLKDFGPGIVSFLLAKPNVQAALEIAKIEDPRAYLEDVVKVLLPDVLRLDTDNAIDGLEITPNGPSFNGRAPGDDFIDLFLFALTGGVLVSDGLPANDCTPAPDCYSLSRDLDNGFPREFPFLGAEHQPQELPIVPRN